MSSCNDDCPDCAELIATPTATHANADCDSVHACGHGTALTQGPKRTKQAISHTGHDAARAGSLPLQAQHTAPEGSPSWQPLISRCLGDCEAAHAARSATDTATKRAGHPGAAAALADWQPSHLA